MRHYQHNWRVGHSGSIIAGWHLLRVMTRPEMALVGSWEGCRLGGLYGEVRHLAVWQPSEVVCESFFDKDIYLISELII